MGMSGRVRTIVVKGESLPLFSFYWSVLVGKCGNVIGIKVVWVEKKNTTLPQLIKKINEKFV